MEWVKFLIFREKNFFTKKNSLDPSVGASARQLRDGLVAVEGDGGVGARHLAN